MDRRREGTLVHTEAAIVDCGGTEGERVDEHEQREHRRRAVGEAAGQDGALGIDVSRAETVTRPVDAPSACARVSALPNPASVCATANCAAWIVPAWSSTTAATAVCAPCAVWSACSASTGTPIARPLRRLASYPAGISMPAVISERRNATRIAFSLGYTDTFMLFECSSCVTSVRASGP